MWEQYWKDGRMIFEVTFPRENWQGHLSANPKLPGWWEAPSPSWEKKGLNHPGLQTSLSQASIWSQPPFLLCPPLCKCQPLPDDFTPFCSLWRNLGVNGIGLGAIVCAGCLWVKLRDACGIKVGADEDMRVGNRLKSHVWSKYLFY